MFICSGNAKAQNIPFREILHKRVNNSADKLNIVQRVRTTWSDTVNACIVRKLLALFGSVRHRNAADCTQTALLLPYAHQVFACEIHARLTVDVVVFVEEPIQIKRQIAVNASVLLSGRTIFEPATIHGTVLDAVSRGGKYLAAFLTDVTVHWIVLNIGAEATLTTEGIPSVSFCG